MEGHIIGIDYMGQLMLLPKIRRGEVEHNNNNNNIDRYLFMTHLRLPVNISWMFFRNCEEYSEYNCIDLFTELLLTFTDPIIDFFVII